MLSKRYPIIVPVLFCAIFLAGGHHSHAAWYSDGKETGTHSCTTCSACLVGSHSHNNQLNGSNNDPESFTFSDGDRWSTTATDGGGLGQGDPTTITWSIVRDGQGGGRFNPDSQLISFFDGLYPGGSGSDLTQRPWFFIFEDSFARITELSGLSFVYEPNDDGSTVLSNSPSRGQGSLGVRGDIRINGYSIDGQAGSNILAQAYFPDRGDITFDTDNTSFFGSTTNDSRASRNVLMHEAGHSIGIAHLESNNAAFLMEPFASTSFDGPQFDDILAIHRGYGDQYEKANSGQGNETAALATSLGLLVDQVTTSIGTHANDTVVGRFETDFVSIDDDTDIDFFSFEIDSAVLLDLTLTPKGPTYNSGPQGGTQSPLVTAALSDLTMTLFDTDGTTPLIQIDNASAGSAESLLSYELEQAGIYFVRITGADNATQLYQLDALASVISSIPADLDGDGDVDGADISAFFVNFTGVGNGPPANPDADLDGDGDVDGADISAAFVAFTGVLAPATVPEPTSLALVVITGLLSARRRCCPCR